MEWSTWTLFFVTFWELFWDFWKVRLAFRGGSDFEICELIWTRFSQETWDIEHWIWCRFACPRTHATRRHPSPRLKMLGCRQIQCSISHVSVIYTQQGVLTWTSRLSQKLSAAAQPMPCGSYIVNYFWIFSGKCENSGQLGMRNVTKEIRRHWFFKNPTA